MSWYVYRLYDAAGNLLYVGCSRQLKTRRAQHAAEQFWFAEVESTRLTGPFPDQASARAVEAAQIRELQPRFNSQHRAQPTRLTPLEQTLDQTFRALRHCHRNGRVLAGEERHAADLARKLARLRERYRAETVGAAA